ncbi:MAG: hypothetical protein ONB46_17255 [candidate division KSB1 bacterium]|nr:hypothetical protein [candidate division KSB1 bacterium]MDZ7367416.1 hypothetical protein [candidate division KSB1 bacterium]MDZ7405479.1 hypothetical protein [candidate division KSB1 bacterium]
MLRTLIAIFLIVSTGCSKDENQNPDGQYFKLDGLNRLLQTATSGVTYLHHALANDSTLAPANDCGIGSLEDLARAALVYLRHAEISGDTTSLVKAEKLLTTVLHLQKPDGLFFAWLDANGQPTLCHHDGTEDFGYPEVRAIWALATGAKAFERGDRAFAQKMQAAFWRSFVHVDSCLLRYGQFSEKDGRQFPQWLPFRSGADAASELILAFDAMSQSSLNDSEQTHRLERAILQFAEGIRSMQAGDTDEFPYGAHLAFESYWHSWNHCAMQALSIAGAKFNRQDFIESAMVEADYFVPYLQKIGFANRFNLLEAQKNPKRLEYFPQSAAAIRPLVTGLIELSKATGQRRYAQRAGEIARWFRGENKANEAVYVEKAGLAKDFIQGHNYVTPTLTASATIEALLTILEVENNPDSRREFYVKIENVFEGKP